MPHRPNKERREALAEEDHKPKSHKQPSELCARILKGDHQQVRDLLTYAFRQAEFDIMYGEGISKVGEILDIGVDYEIIKKSGSWFSYEDTKLGQGRDAVKAILRDNPDLLDELETKIKEAIKLANQA